MNHINRVSTRKSSGFTLIEMLVVIAIIALLAAIVVPSVGGALERAKRTQCTSNLRQVGVAITNYAVNNRNYLPPMRDGGWGGTNVGYPGHVPTGTHWIEFISGYLGEEIGHVSQGAVAGITRACPSWKAPGVSKPGYGMNPYPAAFSARSPSGAGPLNSHPRAIMLGDLDSPSRTILVGDSVDWHMSLTGHWPNGNWWTAGNEWGYYSAHPDRHGDTANYLMADGSVYPLRPDDALPRFRNPVQN